MSIPQESPEISDHELLKKDTRFITKWGLIPHSSDGEKADLRQVLNHFFVEFNPLYLISTLCIFYGVFLVAKNLDAIDQATQLSGQVILFAVLQLYEALIIAGIAFLVFKANAIRPAIILCLLECTLIFDCTFRLEGLSLMDNTGIILFGVWFCLVIIKSWAIAKVMRLEINKSLYICIALIALSTAIIIELFSHPLVDKVLLLQCSAWVGAFVLLSLVFKRPTVTSKLANNAEKSEIAEKCINAGFKILAGFYFYHTLAFMFVATDPSTTAHSLLPQLTAITLLFAVIKTKVQDIIKYAILTLLLGLTAAIGIAYACFILATVFIYHAVRGLHDNLLIIAALLCYTGYTLLGWQGINSGLPILPEPTSAPTLTLALSIFLIAVFYRNIVAYSLIIVPLCYLGIASINSVLPSSELRQGMLIIASGFLTFMVGLGINWWLRFKLDRECSGIN